VFTGSPKFRLHGSIGSGRMSGTPELLGIRSGIVARAACTHGTVWCAESVAVSCRVPNRRHDQAIESVLCRVVLLCCVALVGVESRVWSVSESGAGLCRVLCLVCVLVSTWSGLCCVLVSCGSVAESYRVVSSRIESYYELVESYYEWCCVVSSVDRSGLCRVFGSGLCRTRWCRVGSRSVGWDVESGCVVSPCWAESYVRVVYVYGLVWLCYESCNRFVRIGLVWCRGLVYESYGLVSSRVVCSIGLAYERSATRSGCV
jgi:hypothetical protein